MVELYDDLAWYSGLSPRSYFGVGIYDGPATFLGAWLQVGPLLALGVWAGLSQLDSANTEVSGPGGKGRQAPGPRRSGGGFSRRRAEGEFATRTRCCFTPGPL